MSGFQQRRDERSATQQADHDGGLQNIDLSLYPDEDQEAMRAAADAQAAHINRNTIAEGTNLPWCPDGSWLGETILAQLGQYDRLADTNSDSTRCVQAAALGVYILRGPAATSNFLLGVADALPNPRTRRQEANAAMLQSISTMVGAGMATYDDLSLAQEALHDLSIVDDSSGTSPQDIASQMVTEGGPAVLVPMSEWCSNPNELLGLASDLAAGEQLITTVWRVSVNAAFDQLDQQVAVGGHIDVDMVNDQGDQRAHRLTRIDGSQRPAPGDLDLDDRDHRAGHQVLVFRGDDGSLSSYNPEVSVSGNHLTPIAGEESIQDLFGEQPDYSTYDYVEVQGKLVAAGLAE